MNALVRSPNAVAELTKAGELLNRQSRAEMGLKWRTNDFSLRDKLSDDKFRVGPLHFAVADIDQQQQRSTADRKDHQKEAQRILPCRESLLAHIS
jgi:hypothetical protein